MKANIPFFDYQRLYTDNKKSFIHLFDEVCGRGAFILQKDLTEFETSLAEFSGANFAVGVGNATDGLELAWMAFNLKQGDEVIICSHTMIATASAIKTAGGVPIPVEIGDDGLIDPDAISDAINSRTVGVMPTQLNGRICDMDRINHIVQKHKLILIEDAAQSLGAKYKNKSAGTFGEAGAISFFPAKVLGCFGDGGAILCNDPHLFDKLYQLHDHGRDINGDLKSWGRNSRLDNLQAAFLKYKLQSYDSVIARRRDIASLYNTRLSEIEELGLPPGPAHDADRFDIYQNYEIQAEKRDELKAFLTKNGVGTLVQWGGKAVHQWSVLGFDKKLPKTERFFERCIMLPMNMFISDDDVHYICDVVINFYRS